MGDFWEMFPREVSLTIRAAGERRLNRVDELMYAAWHAALWSHAEIKIKKMPKLEDALTKRARRRATGPLSVEAEIARWDRWAKAGKWQKGN